MSLWLAISLGQAQADTYDLVSLGAHCNLLTSNDFDLTMRYI